MSHSWEEVRALLEDPFVDGDTKEHLLGAYINENHLTGRFDDDELPDEVREYIEMYSMEGGDYDEGSLDEIYDRASTESADRGEQHRQVAEDLETGQAELGDMQTPAATGQGVETSDEIFELARPALRVFETWLPINDRVPEDLRRHGTISLEDVQTRFDEQLGINFRGFLEDADRIRQAHTELTELSSTAERELNSVYQSWSGPAANASYDHYSREFAPNASDLVEALEAAPGLIEAAVDSLFQSCKAKAEQVMELYTPTIGAAPPDIAKRLIKLAKGEEVSQESAKSVASWMDRTVGGDLENHMNNDMWIAQLPLLQTWARDWIRDTFNADLHDSRCATFEQVCDDTLDEVNRVYEELNTTLGEYRNEFSDAGGAQPAMGPGVVPGGSGSGALGPAGAGSMPAGGGGGSLPGGGSGGGSMPAPVMPELPATGMPGGGDGSAPASLMPELPAAAMPGAAGSGTEDIEGTDPAADGAATGVPDGEPSAVSGPDAGQRGTVTIDDGERKITVSSAGGQGEVTITIDDGSGEPTTYRFDLGGPAGGESGAGSEAGAGAVSGARSENGAGSGTGAAEPMRAEPRPLVTPGASDGAGGSVAVIADGDLRITAERPSSVADQVVVTIDDGSGDPATYTVDYSNPDGPAVTAGRVEADQPSLPAATAAAGIAEPGEYTGVAPPGSGEATLATASERGDGSSSGASGGAGMPMMGGMGSAGAGTGYERSPSAWRTEGDLFDDEAPAARFGGVVR